MEPVPEKSPLTRPKRRVRYSGKNPRRFDQKYKETDPEKYPETIEKVLRSGKTPAGSHRPIMVSEILEILRPQPGEFAVDATLGYGGHAVEILKRLQPGGRLWGLDVDPLELPKAEARIRGLGYSGESFQVVRTNFAALKRLFSQEGIKGVDMVLADLGCSSMQLDNPERGFSYKEDGPLDFRMNPQKGDPASRWLEKLSGEKLVTLLEGNADEPHARVIAKGIREAQSAEPIGSTRQLVKVIEKVLGRQAANSIPRVFQALRILVNDEFEVLESFLRDLTEILNPGGRVAILSFHSGEDRRVKKSFQEGLHQGLYRQISTDVIRAGNEETRSNPRSSSAKLRWAIRS